MGISLEVHFELALYPYKIMPHRAQEECLPKKIEIGKTYTFIHREQGIYLLMQEIPLLSRNGKELSRPFAAVRIHEVTHFLPNNSNPREVWTRGNHEVTEIYYPDDAEVHFEGMRKINKV